MANIISVANQKGGVGKTTTAFNLSMALARDGLRVLLVDNDPQGNLTSYAIKDDLDNKMTIDEIYIARRPAPLELNQCTSISENVSIIPADQMLAGAEYYLMSKPNKEFILRNALAGVVEDFDFVIIDNPPALNLLTVNGLVASEKVLVPVQMEFFSLEGIVLLQNTIDQLKDKNPNLEILGFIPSMFDTRRKLNWDVLKLMEEKFGNQMFSTKIHNSVRIAESSGHGASVIDYDPQSRSSQEFVEFAKEVRARCQI